MIVEVKKRQAVLESCGLSKKFCTGDDEILLFSSASLHADAGELISITGKSGSGKSTLLYLLSGLSFPDTGNVTICGRDIYRLNVKERADLRNSQIGFVFQDSLLLDELTLFENIMIPVSILGRNKKEYTERILDLADEVGIYSRLGYKASCVSGGERSRAGLLRALSVNPSVVFLDEPTGSLDSANARVVEDLIIRLSYQQSAAFIYVTHDSDFACRAETRYEIKDRKLVRHLC